MPALVQGRQYCMHWWIRPRPYLLFYDPRMDQIVLVIPQIVTLAWHQSQS